MTGERKRPGPNSKDEPAAKKAHPGEEIRPRGFDRGLQVTSIISFLQKRWPMTIYRPKSRGRRKESLGQRTHQENWCSWSSGKEAMRQISCRPGRPMSSAPRFILLIVCFIRGIEYWSYHDGSHVSYHLDISGSDPVLRGATVLAHLQPGRRRVITQKTLLWQESWSRPAIRSCLCSAVRSLWPVLCSAMQKTVSRGKISKPNFLFPPE